MGSRLFLLLLLLLCHLGGCAVGGVTHAGLIDLSVRLEDAVAFEDVVVITVHPEVETAEWAARAAAIVARDARFARRNSTQQQQVLDFVVETGKRVSLEALAHGELVSPRLVTPSLILPLPWLPRVSKDPREVVEHVRTSISDARRGLSKLSGGGFRAGALAEGLGMSDAQGRHLLNNLCAAPGVRFLEIGSYKGSTLVASLAGNEYTLGAAVAIDAWAGAFSNAEQTAQSIRAAFDAHVAKFLAEDAPLKIVQADAFGIENPRDLLLNVGAEPGAPFDVYFYDGDHSEGSHFKAFSHFDSVLADVFVTVVDDFNHPNAPKGTADAFDKLHYEVLYGEVLGAGVPGVWHNGLYVAVVSRAPPSPSRDASAL